MPKLVIFDKAREVGEFDIGSLSVCMVGRERDNNLVLSDPRISRKHFYIENRSGRFLLVNLSKTHGTKVNGRQVDHAMLEEGDEVEAGNTLLILQLGPVTRQAVAAFQKASPDGLSDDDPSEVTMRAGPPVKRDMHTPVPRAKVNQTVLFAPDRDDTGQRLAVSDPMQATMHAAFESAIREPGREDLRRRFRLLQDIGRQMVTQVRLEDLLDFILRKVFEVLPADNGLILLRNAEGKKLVPKAVHLKHDDGNRQRKLHVSQTLVRQVLNERIGVLCADALSDEGLSGQQSIVDLGIRSVMCAPLMLQDQVLGILHVDNETRQNAFLKEDLDLLTALANQAAVCVHSARLHDQIIEEETRRANLERYFSPAIARRIATDELELKTDSVEVVVLYSDIRGFTGICEQVAPARLVEFLNIYFSEMAAIVFRHGGTFDKFIGDALMAVFGSPVPDEEDALNAARCACEMMELVRSKAYEVGRVEIGIGLHHGKVIHGNVGSKQVMQYTVIGDTVNTTARLSDIARPGQILVSAALRERLGESGVTNSIGEVELKGKTDKLEVFHLTECV